MLALLLILWLDAGGGFHSRAIQAPSMEACWEILPKINSRDVPDNATLTCIELRPEKAT